MKRFGHGRMVCIGLGLVLWLGSAWGMAGEDAGEETLEIPSGLLELRTGAGRGYPVIFSVEAGEKFTLVRRRGDWVQIQVRPGLGGHRQWLTGWVEKQALSLALDGTAPETGVSSGETASAGDWSVRVAGGQMDAAALAQLDVQYHFSASYALVGEVTQVLGAFSELRMLAFGLNHRFVDIAWLNESGFEPWVGVSGGVVQIHPKATLVQEEKRLEELVRYSVGLSYHVDARYSVGVRYVENLVFTERDKNEHPSAWMADLEVKF